MMFSRLVTPALAFSAFASIALPVEAGVQRAGPPGRGVARAVPRIAAPVVARPRIISPRIISGVPYRPYYYGYRPGFSLGFYAGYPYGYPYGYYPYGYGYGYYYGPYGYPLPPAGYVTASPGVAYGGVRIEGAPRDAQVFADGYYVGVVDEFDGVFQHLNLTAGPHRIEIRSAGNPPVQFDVRIEPGQTITYRAH